ncbi:MAG TPA: sialidase family protein [Gemmatimonadales bacterium]|jgi:hypothetical protein|nr:sialidase family protein [Gemmatimonadales bacterium]
MRPVVLLLALTITGCQQATGPSDLNPSAKWSSPVALFGISGRLAAGTKLHAVGSDGGGIQHRSSSDEGATWSASTPIPGAGPDLPLYGALAVQGSTVHLLTRSGASLRMQRSLDGGATWSAGTTLTGYTADGGERVQIATDGNYVHVFLGRAGAVPDNTFKNYYWRSPDQGQTWSGVRILDDPTGPPSPGGIAAENGTVHIAYAAILPGVGSLGHRARYLRSTDNGATWSPPVDVSGGSTRPQIRPRPRVVNGRVIVIWEEPLDHNPLGPFPNATRGQIRANRSLDNGSSWQGTFDVSAVSGVYPNHPEIAVGPGGQVHVIYRLSKDQATLSTSDVVAYRHSTDYGATWSTQETAVAIPGVETHPYNAVTTGSFVHLMVGGTRFYHVRRSLP